MFGAGLAGVDDDMCKVCHDQVGDLYHRCCGCSGLSKAFEGHAKHREILGVAQSALRYKELLFQHGFPQLQDPLPPPAFLERWCGGRSIDGFQFTGKVSSLMALCIWDAGKGLGELDGQLWLLMRRARSLVENMALVLTTFHPRSGLRCGE